MKVPFGSTSPDDPLLLPELPPHAVSTNDKVVATAAVCQSLREPHMFHLISGSEK
ncbi:hypothetical protein Atai01_56480 [Amycolatopsis taiwanensis]|uniref:Uncharacterized protein n=1 Tax=Amycolatopsis taiwanensis TaxID=342230 RepID=A0A9W6R4M0_9PSEU|nr:hypothetical protein Atai01_56480 [Amycolatopsis taiwanensis]